VNAGKVLCSPNPKPLLFARLCDPGLSVACAGIDAAHQLHLLALAHTRMHVNWHGHVQSTSPHTYPRNPSARRARGTWKTWNCTSLWTPRFVPFRHTRKTRTNVRFHRDHLFGDLLPERALNAAARGTQQLFGKLRQTLAVNRLTCTPWHAINIFDSLHSFEHSAATTSSARATCI